MAGKVRYFDCI